MAGSEKNETDLPNDSNAYYEQIASQEEIFLETNEEEVRAILFAEVCSSPPEDLGEEKCEAALELITGDSDDPPLSEEVIRKMINAS